MSWSPAAAQQGNDNGSGGPINRVSKQATKQLRKTAKINRRSLRGDLIGRGRKIDKNRDGKHSDDECDFDIAIGTEIAEGARRITCRDGSNELHRHR
jgi:hypothetical protein